MKLELDEFNLARVGRSGMKEAVDHDAQAAQRQDRGQGADEVEQDEDIVSEGSVNVGCIVLSVNDKDTPSVDAFNEVVDSLKSGDHVKVVYLRPVRGGGTVRQVAVLTVD